MPHSHWLKQEGEPLFPDMLWSRPENRTQAGKLLVIGGQQQGFTAPASVYGEVLKAGAGTARVVLPDSLSKTVGKVFPEAEFAPSNPSGSFALAALAEFLGAAVWADGVVLAGDFGRNSETTVLLETFLEKYPHQVTLVDDAAEHFSLHALPVLHRPDTVMVLTMAQLQRLGSSAHFPRAFTSDMGLVALVDALHEFTKRFLPAIITCHDGHCIVAVDGRLSTTPSKSASGWPLTAAAQASVWWLQNPTQEFAALTTAVYEASS